MANSSLAGALVALLALASSAAAESYLPKVVYGTPQSMEVVALDPPDAIRQETDLYVVSFTVLTEDGQSNDSSIVHRAYPEFQMLASKIAENGYKSESSELPEETGVPEDDIQALNDYLQELAQDEELLESTLLSDFLAANWDGKDLTFLQSLDGFLYMLLVARVPEFIPEPPYIEQDDYLAEEFPFEVYVYMQAFRHEKKYTDEYLEFFGRYCDATPSWQNPEGEDVEDETDVAHPDAEGPIEIPYHYNLTYVHFLPGGYLNGHTVRISYNGKTKFSFLDEDRIKEWITDLYGDLNPKRILDVGTGNCFSAFALAELYPDAEIVGIDLAPPYIRFCREWKEDRGVSNVEFYQANAESLPFYDDGYFDFINYAYVLHEMPGDNARVVIDELYRILAPGGVLNGFEVPYVENDLFRKAYTLLNTWGYDWDVVGDHGPEPYIEEFEESLVLPQALEEAGFEDVEVIGYSFFESIFQAYKPK